jgi:hypothetical protein
VEVGFDRADRAEDAERQRLDQPTLYPQLDLKVGQCHLVASGNTVLSGEQGGRGAKRFRHDPDAARTVLHNCFVAAQPRFSANLRG